MILFLVHLLTQIKIPCLMLQWLFFSSEWRFKHEKNNKIIIQEVIIIYKELLVIWNHATPVGESVWSYAKVLDFVLEIN